MDDDVDDGRDGFSCEGDKLMGGRFDRDIFLPDPIPVLYTLLPSRTVELDDVIAVDLEPRIVPSFIAM